MEREPQVMVIVPPLQCLHIAYQDVVGAPIEWTMMWIAGAFREQQTVMFLSMGELLLLDRILTHTDPRETTMPDGQKATEMLAWVWLAMLRLERGENDDPDDEPDRSTDRGPGGGADRSPGGGADATVQ